MYQAWVVQNFNGTPYNVILGEEHETIEDAYDTIRTYEEMFGKVERKIVEPSGTPIPVSKVHKESLWKTLADFVTRLCWD